MKGFSGVCLQNGMVQYNTLPKDQKGEKARAIMQEYIINRFPSMMALINFDCLEPKCNEFRAIDNYASEFPVLKEELDDNGKPMMDSLKVAEQTHKETIKVIAGYEPRLADIIASDEQVFSTVRKILEDVTEEVARYADKGNTKEPYVYFHYSEAIMSAKPYINSIGDPMKNGTNYYGIIEKIQKDVEDKLNSDQKEMSETDFVVLQRTLNN